MMDFLIREGRTIVEGPMAIIRLGTCGGLYGTDKVGTFMLSDSSCFVGRNVDAFMNKSDNATYYTISQFCNASQSLTDTLEKELKNEGKPYARGKNATADSFYSSQGRLFNDWFIDHNEHLIDNLIKHNVRSLEMETFYLFHLAHCTSSTNRIDTASVKILLANRITNDFLFSDEDKHELEKAGGRACLRALQLYHFN